MFARFPDARRIVVRAEEEARMLSHHHIGTEHILLALVHERAGTAAAALESLGVTEEAVREQVEEVIGRGQRAAPGGQIPITPRAKKALELSLPEAVALGHTRIGTEHILLGLVREGENPAAQVLHRLGVDQDRVRAEVIRRVPARRVDDEAGA